MQAYPRSSTARPQWLRLARMHLGLHAYLGLWFWAILVLLWLVVIGGSQLLGGFLFIPDSIELSYFQFSIHAALWFPFSVGIASAVLITATVGNGATRRSFALGAIAGMAAAGLLYGTLLALGFTIEGWIYEAAGWPQAHIGEAMGEPEQGAVFWQQGFLMTWVSSVVRVAGGVVAGLLVGLNYYRFGAWRGTALLPFGLIPALLAQDDLVRWVGHDLGFGLGFAVVLTVVVVLVSALIVRYLAAGAVIKQQWSRHGE